MTRRRKLKRRIRERMVRTGESYSTARSVIARRARATPVGTPVVMVPVGELPRAIAFYRDALGFPLIHRDADDSWAEVGDGRTVLGLHPGARTGADTGIGIVAGDVEALCEAVVAHGGEIASRANGVTTIRDPDGNLLRVMQAASSS